MNVSRNSQCSSIFIRFAFYVIFPVYSRELQHRAGFHTAVHVANRMLACATPLGNRICDSMPPRNFSHVAKVYNLPRRRASQFDFAGNRLGIIFLYQLSHAQSRNIGRIEGRLCYLYRNIDTSRVTREELRGRLRWIRLFRCRRHFFIETFYFLFLFSRWYK